MKLFKKLGLIIFSFIVVVSYGCGGDKSQDTESEEHVPVEINMENLTVVDYSIKGMVCAMGCAATIQDEVIDMSGVASSQVFYEEEKAHFEFDSAIISEKEIIAKIESLADGQYQVDEWVETKEDIDIENVKESEEEGNSEAGHTITEVSLPSFEIPNLFTLILDQL